MKHRGRRAEASSLVTTALLLVVALLLSAPTDSGTRLDIHGSQPFHLVFNHHHPDEPSRDDQLTSWSYGAPQLHGGSVVSSFGSAAVSGQVLPRLTTIPAFDEPVWHLTRSNGIAPRGLEASPPDPPPKLV